MGSCCARARSYSCREVVSITMIGLLVGQGHLHVGFQKGQPVEHGHVHVQQDEARTGGTRWNSTRLVERAQGLLSILGHEHLLGYAHAGK
jgi:hypothetical protein